MAVNQGFVTLNYIENVSGDTDLLDLDAPITEPVPEEVTIVVEDLYAALKEVETGTREVPFKLETRGDTYFIRPRLRAGHPFTLPRDPDAFQSATTSWTVDGVSRTFKIGVFDELFPPMPMPPMEE